MFIICSVATRLCSFFWKIAKKNPSKKQRLINGNLPKKSSERFWEYFWSLGKRWKFRDFLPIDTDKKMNFFFSIENKKLLTFETKWKWKSTFLLKSEASPGKNRAGLYKYKYNGKELQDELGLNFYDYGFRNYMPDIGRWGNVDPLAELYVGINPYAYTLNNPVLFLDPDGRYVDDSYIYEKYKKGDHKGEYKNPSLVKAWEIFAKSKSGSAFLSNFARKGQMIAGEKFKGESGKFDKKNIDLNFGTKTQGFADAEASSAVKGSHLQITIGLSEGGDSVAPDLSGFIDDISHEAFVHAESTAFDFYKDGKIDFDNIDNDIVKSINAWIKEDPKTRAGSRSNAMQHNQDERSGISIDKTFSILKEYYRNANIKKSDKQIKTEANYYYNH